MAGIGNVQLGVNLTGSDVHNMRLTRTATGMASATGGFIWNPTTRHILKREETDKQNDDNLTFLFEYRALLNSRVQTLITQLSNALASDLDVAMNADNRVWNDAGGAPSGDRPAMNGRSTNTQQDAGAARAGYNFMMGWFSENNYGGTAVTDALDNGSGTPAGNVAPNDEFDMTFQGRQYNPVTGTVGAANNFSNDLVGTGTIVTANNLPVDALMISGLYTGSPTISYANARSENTGGGVDHENPLDDSFAGPLGQAARNAQAKNLFQKVLFDAASSIEYKAVLSSGLFKNLVVAASSSLPTGSQIQASFNLSYSGAQDAGSIQIIMDKMTAFYHS